MSVEFQRLLRQLESGLSLLPDKPEETPDTTLRALWHAAAGTRLSTELSAETALADLDSAAQTRLQELIAQRLSGTPLAHITGRQRFMGMEMLTGNGALIPRKETELLARAAIQAAQQAAKEAVQPRVVDVCTGSGNVVLAVARHVPQVRAFAADLSEDAVLLARENALHLQLADRVSFAAGDLLEPFNRPEFHGKVDVLSCNPPYISSAKVGQMAGEISAHEPRLAFDGGPFGVAILMRLLEEAPRYIRQGGWLAFEVGLGQGPMLVKRMEKAGGYRQISPQRDAKGDVRAILAQR